MFLCTQDVEGVVVLRDSVTLDTLRLKNVSSQDRRENISQASLKRSITLYLFKFVCAKRCLTATFVFTAQQSAQETKPYH